MRNEQVAVLYLTDTLTGADLGNLGKLQQGIGEKGQVFVLFDSKGLNKLGNNCSFPIHAFDFDDFHQFGIPILGDSLIPGNPFLAHVSFFKEWSDFDYYWRIESDVRFSGKWRYFFETFEKYGHDFVSSNIRQHSAKPGWLWWNIEHPSKSIPIEDRISSFNPVYRLSNRAMHYLIRELSTGWKGHFETTLATLIKQSPELTILDMGNDGTYTPEALRNKIYRSGIVRNASIRGSTFHYRPPFLFCGFKRNHLYHPVKPLKFNLIYLLKKVKNFLFVSLWRRSGSGNTDHSNSKIE